MGKRIIIIALLFVISGTVYCQAYPGSKNFRKGSTFNRKKTKRSQHYNNGFKRIDLLGHIGLSFGQETLIGLPKLGGICRLNFKRAQSIENRPFKGSSFYVGADLSMFVLFAGAFSSGIQAGFKFGPITIDNSFSRLSLMSPESDIVARQTTYNPKIGLVIGPAWLKFGPSYIIKGDNILRDGFGMNNFPFNAELCYIGSL